MSEKQQLVLMAEYNQLMNQRIVAAAEQLSEAAFNEDKGAFFGSVNRTLNHIMVGDVLWLKRFAKHPALATSLKAMDEFPMPESLDQLLFAEIAAFKQQREKLDAIILQWCGTLEAEAIDSNLEYANTRGEKHAKHLGALILHVFLHQVHHRGQVTTLLSQEGIDFGDTDLPEIVPEVGA